MSLPSLAFITGEDAVTVLLGFALVMGTLVVLWGVTALVGKIPGTAAPEPTVAPPIARAPAPAPDQSEAHIAAVISAAVAVTLAEPHRIIRFRQRGRDWSREGRRSIFASHKVR